MRLRIQPEGILERIGLWFNLAPIPLVATQVSFNAARAIMAGASLGIFDALEDQARTASEVATRCGTHPKATEQLLFCLVGIEYLRCKAGKYSNVRRLRKWLLRDGSHSLHDKLLFQQVEWEWMSHLEEFVKTGKPIHFHENLSAQEWTLYQNGMRSMSSGYAEEVARKLPMPRAASQMLDIGGSHGLISMALCKRHKGLSSTVLELPGALERASEIVQSMNMADRVRHQGGDALTEELGENRYDLILLSHLVHHFTAEQNASLALRAAGALKPGGYMVINELVRSQTPGAGGAVGATSDLYFALTSASGTWSSEEMFQWQISAGLQPRRKIHFLSIPGYAAHAARKAGA